MRAGQHSQSGERFDIEMPADHESHASLVGSHRELSSRSVNAINVAAIVTTPRQHGLCIGYDLPLNIWRRSFVRCAIQNAIRLRLHAWG